MLAYARTASGKRIFVGSAKAGCDYFCIECAGRLRVRRSELRKAHFFHLALQSHCRHAAKSAAHIALQNQIQKALGTDCDQEVPFPEIGRIADLAWKREKIVIEVQCSPIASQEVEARTKDYASIGWEVVWILHSRSFNALSPSPTVRSLDRTTHYFANAHGEIQDMIWRKWFGVDISTLRRRQDRHSQEAHPEPLQKRLLYWSCTAEGDVLWQKEQGNLKIRRQKFLEKVPSIPYLRALFSKISSFCRSLWYLLLERSCR